MSEQVLAASLVVAPAVSYLPAQWLPIDAPALESRIVRDAICDVHTWEQPLGSNRGPEIDRWLRWAGVPESVILSGKGYWCMAWGAYRWHQAGAEVLRTASCDAMLAWGRKTGRFSEHVASLGAFVFYGKWLRTATGRQLVSKTDAIHVGLCSRIDVRSGRVGSTEGNTSVEGAALERNGTAVATKLVTPEDPVIGYVHVYPLASR